MSWIRGHSLGVLLVIGLVTATGGASAFTAQNGAYASDVNSTVVAPADAKTFTVQQGERCTEVSAIGDGSESVEDFYDYRLPEDRASEANGGSDPGSGPYYASAGTESLQQDGESLLFLYNGQDGMSLVIVHDSLDSGPSGGGAATLEIDGLPDDGTWVVKDDYYLDPDTGEIAATNYDNWRVDESSDVIDWTWDDGRTDGGVFRGLDGESTVTIDPAFNEKAALYGEHYNGSIHSWRLLNGSGRANMSLNMDQELTIQQGRCDGMSPSAALSAQPTNATVDEPVTLDGSDSSAETGIAEFRWDFDADGIIDRITTDATTTYAYSTAGSYKPSVTVLETDGNTDTASTTVNVTTETEGDVPRVVGDNPVSDVDGDGSYEDVNGDGEFDVNDITAIWAHRDSDAVTNDPQMFDFNDDGSFDVNDVTKLWNDYLAS